MGGRDIECSK
jgi:hypothetical protein